MRRYLIPLILITFVMSSLHAMIYWAGTFSLPDHHPAKPLAAVLLAVAVILMPLGMVISQSSKKVSLRWITIAAYFWMGIFSILWFLSIVQSFVLLVGFYEYSYWIFPAGFVISLYAAYNGLKLPKVVVHEIKGPEFLRGTTLIQISDLHVGMPFLDSKWLQKIVERINLQNADIIAITGDLVDDAFQRASLAIEPLKFLIAKKQKFYVTGNHEYIRGGDWEKRLKELGFNSLHNSHAVVQIKQGSLLVAGVPDRMVSRFHQSLESQPDLALNSSRKVDYKLLLAHEPSSVFDLKKESCDLIISGHTHGGQIFPFGLIVRIVQPVVSGFKKVRGTLVFAHQGTGFWGPPMRWFTRSEIVKFVWV